MKPTFILGLLGSILLSSNIPAQEEWYRVNLNELKTGTNLVLKDSEGRQLYFNIGLNRDGSQRIDSRYIVMPDGGRADLSLNNEASFLCARGENSVFSFNTEFNIGEYECSSAKAGKKGTRKIAFVITDGIP